MFEGQIREFLKKHQAGYILLIDFTKYFENIDHDKVIEFYKKNFKDERLVNYFIQSIKCYDKGLGLGSEISQFNAIIYLNTIDHYIKSRFKYYRTGPRQPFCGSGSPEIQRTCQSPRSGRQGRSCEL